LVKNNRDDLEGSLTDFIYHSVTDYRRDYTDLLSVKHRTWESQGGDSKKVFDKRLKDPNLKRYLQPYINEPVKYVLNRHHCRMDWDIEFLKNEPVDIYLGCSHTFGTGHHVKNIWPTFVSEHTGNVVANLGIGGAGIEVSYHRLLQFISRLNVKNIFHYQPAYPRYAFVNDNGHLETWLAQEGDVHNIFAKNYSKDHLLRNYLENGPIAMVYFKHVNLIKMEADRYNIPYFHIGMEPEDYLTSRTEYPYRYHADDDKLYEEFVQSGNIAARDLQHYPLSFMKAVAKDMIEMYDKYPEGYMNTSFDFDKARQYYRRQLI
jgi:hypothetical protein